VEFPYSADLPNIEAAIQKLKKTIAGNEKKKGFETIINSELEPAAATFAYFRSAQSSLVKSLEEYKRELDHIRSQLPRRDVVKQYGRAIICSYVRGVLRRPALPLVENLLDCFKEDDPKGNLARDIKEFQDSRSDFCGFAEEFLDTEHDAPSRLGELNWNQFQKSGKL
jgi:hypothetical protein